MRIKRILVADDDSDMADAMADLLRSRGHHVYTACSGEEALTLFSEKKPDLVFLDLMMEKFDTGVRVCRKIRESDTTVPVYLVSAVGDEAATILDTHEIGFSGAVSKPLMPEELLGLLDLHD